MRTRLTTLAGLLLGMGLMSSGPALASAHSVMGAVPAVSTAGSASTGSGVGASLMFHLGALPMQAQATDPCAQDAPDANSSDTDNIQDQNGADDAAEGDTGTDQQDAQNPSDTDNLQCGDQTGGPG